MTPPEPSSDPSPTLLPGRTATGEPAVITRDLEALLDPDLIEMFSTLPDLVDAVQDPEAARALRDERFSRLAGETRPSVVPQRDVHVPGLGDDDPPVLVRVYRPEDRETSAPAILWFHGGGFNGGSVRYEDAVCEYLAQGVGATVVSVEYRLLPESCAPAPVEDGYAVLRWVIGHAEAEGVDPTRIAVAGLSAGATIAAGVALLARDRGDAPLAFQLLLYGSTDDALDTASADEFLDPRSPNREQAGSTWTAYVGPAADPRGYAVPMHAPTLAGLPPTYVAVGAVEMVRDENVAFAQRLMRAHVPTELHVFPGAFHGFDVLVPDARVSVAARKEYLRVLRRALGEAAR